MAGPGHSQILYVGLYDRPGDRAGQGYWSDFFKKEKIRAGGLNAFDRFGLVLRARRRSANHWGFFCIIGFDLCHSGLYGSFFQFSP